MVHEYFKSLTLYNILWKDHSTKEMYQIYLARLTPGIDTYFQSYQKWSKWPQMLNSSAVGKGALTQSKVALNQARVRLSTHTSQTKHDLEVKHAQV